MTQVLVTGASGFIGLQCAHLLASEGYKVRGTVRSLKNETKINAIRSAMPKDAKYEIELVEADLTGEYKDWVEAVRCCEYVLHVASPVITTNITDKESQLIQPALKGTQNVLKACEEVGGVKRVVVTSSVNAVCGDTLENGKTFDEKMWVDVEKEDVSAYTESKVKAEKWAYEFVEGLEGLTTFYSACVCFNKTSLRLQED